MANRQIAANILAMHARLLLVGMTLAVAGCGHTSEASKRAIYDEVDDFNGKSEARAFAQALASARATVMDVPEEQLFVGDLERCRSGYGATPAPAEVTVKRSSQGGSLVVPCAGMLSAALRAGAVDAKTDAGDAVTIVPSRPRGTSDVARLARGPGGAILDLTPAPHVVRTREVSQAGTCDRMPQPISIPPTLSAYVLPGAHAAEVKRIHVAYDAEDVRVVCDHYTY